MSTPVQFRVSGKAMGTMEGSEITSDAVKYDGGTQGAHDALAALTVAEGRRAGNGWTYVVTTTPEGAKVIRDYCATVGDTFTQGDADADVRAEGRALLVVVERIDRALEG